MNATASSNQTQEARRGEAVLVVMQDNSSRTITVAGANPMAETLLRVPQGALDSLPVVNILGAKLNKAITEDVEFTEGAPDFGDIFSRQREVKLRCRNGEEIPVSCRLSRLMSQGKNACFQLVVADERERSSQQKLQDFIRLNLDGRKVVDGATGLPDRNTAKTFLPLLKNYLAESHLQAVFAVVHLDRFDKSLHHYGSAACTQLLAHAHSCCRASFRSVDLMFALSDRALGVVLFDISRESARIVLNRLRWAIKSHRFDFGGKPDFSISTSISFDMLNPDAPLAALEECEAAIEALEANERNHLIELHAAA